MEPSQAPHESPAKAGDKEVERGSLSRFKALTKRLFAVDSENFKDALSKDEEERRAKRSR
jgi:hypothetical protein